VFLRSGSRVASACSVLNILLLSATVDAQLEVQASGEDEDAAVRAAEVFFLSSDDSAGSDGRVVDTPTNWPNCPP
jgi:phosphotransferase system HPr-like phosphotransfer protein